MTVFRLPLGVVAALFACCAVAEDLPAATPYRPTVSNPADLSAPHWLEVEAGVQGDRGRGVSGDSLPYLIKYAFSEDWGLLLGGNAYLRSVDSDGGVRSGFGDTQLLVKHRIKLGEQSAFGFETGLRAPTAPSGLGSSQPDYLFNGIFSSDIGAGDDAPHLDINLGSTWVGAREPGSARLEFDWAASVSKNLLPRWNAAIEYSGTERGGTDGTRQLLAAVAFAARPSLVFDLGLARGLSAATTGWSVFAGVTAVVGRLR